MMNRKSTRGETRNGRREQDDQRPSFPADVPPDLWPVFEKAHDFVRRYFTNRVESTDRGSISISGERYVLLRAASLSKEFFDLIHSLYRDRGEEEARALLNAIGDRALLLDREGKILALNEVAARAFGGISEEFVGRCAFDLFPDDVARTQKGYHEEVLRCARSVRYQDVRDGCWLETVLCPITGDQDRVVRVGVISRDITEYKEAEEELKKSRSELEEEKKKMQARLEDARKMEAIATLAGGIAHEFNNALASISLNLDLLLMNAREGKDTSGMVKQMRGSTQRMAQLTSQLLAYAQGGKYQVKAFSLSDLVRETLPSISHTLEPAVHVDTDLPPDVQAVQADLMQMQMVLSAILSNASEAIDGEGHIRIFTRNEYLTEETAGAYPDIGPGRYVSLTIDDNGKGMDEETRSRIFEPFFTTKFQGRGLGMPAVYGIVRNHGGCVLVESRIGKGTTVRVYLPAVEQEEVKPRIREAEPSRGGRTILLVEDEGMIMEVSRALLERLGYRVLAAENGKEAVRIAMSHE